MVSVISTYEFADMKVVYLQDEESKAVGMYLLPGDMEPLPFAEKRQELESLVQVKYVGDTYLGSYAGGMTLRQGESAKRMCLKEQKEERAETYREIITVLEDARGYEAVHHLRWYYDEQSVEVFTDFNNVSGEMVELEMLSSFSMGGLTPFTAGDAHDSLQVHRIRSVWSMEGRVETRSVEDLQLEPSWAYHAVRCERFGQAGSMPVNRFFPFAAVEDTANDVIWGVQLAHNASWQIELYRKDDGLSMSGGLADADFGHWKKQIRRGESFTTPKAILSVCQGGLDSLCQRLTQAGDKYFEEGPEGKTNLPIIFNEYCTTWGCPSHENISGIVDVIRDKGFDYFVIDCGWFKEEGVHWDISMGDYVVSEDLFPDGLDKTIDVIKAAGMKPGIWFEIDNVGSAARAYQLTDHLLKRDGHTLTTTMRRFWDMRQEWVQNYLTERVIDMIKKYHIEYVKMDYNDSIGVGCDGAESLGEGLRQNMEASVGFIRRMKQEIPGLILENCASGGHKLEPLMMSECSMASFSDAHECEEIPVIAANLHRTILPCQSQIWCVIRKEDSLKRIAYSLINTFLGRMCLSGDVTELSKEQWQLIDDAMAFYRKIAPSIRKGYTTFYGSTITSYRHLEGWQGILREGTDGEAFAVLHMFNGKLERMEMELPAEYEIEGVYAAHTIDSNNMWTEGNKLYYMPDDNMQAAAVRLRRVK
ncbi:MAG: alpha-galactosidase [Lachnospiraceae bacterium]|nr:alpha-galactosidase [Lachnospiraceae bacterium]